MAKKEAVLRYWMGRELEAARELEAFVGERVGDEDPFEILLKRYSRKLVKVLEAESPWMGARQARVRLQRAAQQLRSSRTVLDFLCNEKDISHADHLRALVWIDAIERIVKPAYESASTRVSTSNDLS